MNRYIKTTLLGICVVSGSAMADYYLDLEPCINGNVSASGLFANQEAEDRFIKARQTARNQELEPCINGDVSASGLFPNQAAEDLYDKEALQKFEAYGATAEDAANPEQ